MASVTVGWKAGSNQITVVKQRWSVGVAHLVVIRAQTTENSDATKTGKLLFSAIFITIHEKEATSIIEMYHKIIILTISVCSIWVKSGPKKVLQYFETAPESEFQTPQKLNGSYGY